jgi:autotransporter-associated beta strand protein
MHTHIPHTTRFPRLLTAAATAAALTAVAPLNATEWNDGGTHTISINTLTTYGDAQNAINSSTTVNIVQNGYLQFQNTDNVLVIGGVSSGTLNVTGTGRLSTNGTTKISDGGRITVTDAKSVWYSDYIEIEGSGILDIANGGQVTTNGLRLGYAPGGTLKIGGSFIMGGVTTGSYASTATVSFNGGTIRTIVPDGTVLFDGVGTLTLDGTGLAEGIPALTLETYAGTSPVIREELVGDGGLRKTGSTMTLTLSGANTYTGATEVNTGTLALTGAGSVAGSSGLTLADNTTLDISGSNSGASVKSLNSTFATSSVVLGSKTLTVANAAANTFAGVISGSGGFTKTGVGTLTLSNAHTYTGTTTVADGVLKITGTLNGGTTEHVGNIALAGGGVISFASGSAPQKFSGILSGTGTIEFDGTQSVVVAGTLSPGAAAGDTATLEFSNTTGVTLAAGARFVVDLKAVGTPDGNDLLIVTGGKFVMGGELVIRLDSALTKALVLGDEFVIARAFEGANILGAFTNVNGAAQVQDEDSERFFRLAVRAGAAPGTRELVLTATTPEPSTYALIGGASVLLLAFWRKRRQRTRTGRRL